MNDFVWLKGYGSSTPKTVRQMAAGDKIDLVFGAPQDFSPSDYSADPFAEAMALELIEPVDFKTSADRASYTELPPEGMLPNLSAIQADSCVRYNGKGVTVAILDTGIEERHDAFAAFRKVEKFSSDDFPQMQVRNFTDDIDTSDRHGHGTHCAGIVCGRSVSGRRIGVAQGVDRLLIGKVIGQGGTSTQLVAALDWAMTQGANVISMSLSFNFWDTREFFKTQYGDERAATSKALHIFRQNVDLFKKYVEILELRFRRKPLIISAVGNTSQRPKYALDRLPPSAAEGILAVGACDGSGVAYFSNENPEFVAPGVNVWSANKNKKDGLTQMSGTSMACPHVAGLAALYWQKAKEMYGDSQNGPVLANIVRDELRSSAKALRSQKFSKTTWTDAGYGEPHAPSDS